MWIILELRKQNMRMWTGFSWPRTRPSDGLLLTKKWTFEFHKRL
jgi:hypothetical protein